MNLLNNALRNTKGDISALMTAFRTPNFDDTRNVSEQLTHLVGGELPQFGYFRDCEMLFECG